MKTQERKILSKDIQTAVKAHFQDQHNNYPRKEQVLHDSFFDDYTQVMFEIVIYTLMNWDAARSFPGGSLENRAKYVLDYRKKMKDPHSKDDYNQQMAMLEVAKIVIAPIDPVTKKKFEFIIDGGHFDLDELSMKALNKTYEIVEDAWKAAVLSKLTIEADALWDAKQLIKAACGVRAKDSCVSIDISDF